MNQDYVDVARDRLLEKGLTLAAQALQDVASSDTGVSLLRAFGFEHEAEVLESCIQWSEDTEGCHLCGRYMMHDEEDVRDVHPVERLWRQGDPVEVATLPGNVGHDDDCPVGLIAVQAGRVVTA